MLDEYGLEIEFGSRMPDITLSRAMGVDLSADSIYYIQNSTWNISEDFSASYGSLLGMELRSPKFTIFPEDDLLGYTHQLSENGCAITPTSGLHIHFSGPSYAKLSFLNDSRIQEISKRLFSLAKPNKEREKYCDPLGLNSTKRCALRQICDSHWECRVFNSTFSVAEIQNCFNLLVRILDEY